MRRIISLFILLSFISILLMSSKVRAQEEFNFNQAYQDYTFNTDEYRKTEARYQLKRSEYLRHDTLASKDEAITATRDFLKARDRVIETYLTALRLKLSETPGMADSEKEIYYSRLDPQVGWYQDHINRIDSAGTLDDLVDDSEEAATKLKTTELIAYETLNAISTAKLNALNSPLSDLLGEIKSKASEIRGNGDKDTSIAEKWILDAENEMLRSREKVDAARLSVLAIKESDKSNSKRGKFNSSQTTLDESHQHLKETSRYMGEIIIEIKTED